MFVWCLIWYNRIMRAWRIKTIASYTLWVIFICFSIFFNSSKRLFCRALWSELSTCSFVVMPLLFFVLIQDVFRATCLCWLRQLMSGSRVLCIIFFHAITLLIVLTLAWRLITIVIINWHVTYFLALQNVKMWWQKKIFEVIVFYIQ